MADFYQNGIVTTLHNLHQRSVDELEDELRKFKKKRPMALVLPSLYSELEGEALPHIVKELSHVDYLSRRGTVSADNTGTSARTRSTASATLKSCVSIYPS